MVESAGIKSNAKMACNVIKCNHCKIVINEVLVFVQNKADVMTEEGIVRLCVSAFSPEEIETAKSLLFDSITTSKKKVTRKNCGKSERNVYDIITLFKETDPDCTPIFVARLLEKLPPLCFDQLDATRILKDLLLLQNDMKAVKENYVTMGQFQELQTRLQAASSCGVSNVNTKRGACLLESFSRDSGPMGLQHCPERSSSPENSNKSQELADTRSNISNGRDESSPALRDRPAQRQRQRSPMHRPSLSHSRNHRVTVSQLQSNDISQGDRHSVIGGSCLLHSNAHNVVLSNSKPFSDSTDKQKCQLEQNHSFADIIRMEGEWKSEEPSEEWKLVQKKRHRNRFMGLKSDGITEPDSKFKAAATKIPMFIYNVSKDTTVSDIGSYITRKIGIEVTIERVSMKREKEYNSFKILVPKHKLDLFMDSKLWPDGISFRQFVDFTHRKTTSRLDERAKLKAS